MKLTKKLLPALGMLALSACMLVTSTFAWFSMNEKVTATNMQVSAKGNQVYLQIINPNAETGSNEKSFVNGAAQTTATATSEMTELLPVNVVNKSNVKSTETTVGDKTVTTWENRPYGVGEIPDGSDTPAEDYATIEWVTNIGASTTDGSASKKYDTVSSGANYYLQNTFQIRLDPTAGASSANALDIAGITATITGTATGDDSFKKCLSVLVVSSIYDEADIADLEHATALSTMGQVWEYSGTSNSATTFVQRTVGGGAETLSDGDFLAETIAVVDIYVFFNGDSSVCTQAMLALAAALNYNITVEFTVA